MSAGEGARRAGRLGAMARLAWLSGAMLSSAWGTSCQDHELQLCGQIPEHGCPIGRGGSCEDALCESLYDCVEGGWTKVETCPGFEAPTGTGTGVGTGGQGGGACVPIEIDHTGEVNGCVPDLLEPDCPVEAAEQCADSACSTGCADFFLCTEDGWADVAFCSPEGDLVVLQ